MGQRILVVDDSPENRIIVRTCLAAEGYTVSELSSGEELLNLGNQAKQFDLILLDVMMPTLNGYETCKRLKQNSQVNHIPIIFLSAESDESSRVSGFEAGGVDYVLKPFSRKELGMRIKAHLALSGKFQAVKIEKEKLSASLKEGAHIQAAFLPSQAFEHPNIKLSWHYEPVEHIAGDMFGYITFDDGSLGVYLLDVCGHGPSAALVASAVHGAMTSNKELTGTMQKGSYFPIDPCEVIKNLSQEFPFERFERYFTFLYVLIHPRSHSLICSSAGHPAPFLFQSNTGTFSKVPVIGKILGLDKSDSWEQQVIKITSGSKIVLVSDGVLEIKNMNGQSFESVILPTLSKYVAQSSEEIVKSLAIVNKTFSHGVQSQDDLTILCIEYK